MRVEGNTIYKAWYDGGFVIEKSEDELLETMAEKLKEEKDLPDNFYMSETTQKIKDGGLNLKAEEIKTKKLLVYAFESDED